ncbi:MAG: aminotransferase class IV [Chloroflexota bacterium]
MSPKSDADVMAELIYLNGKLVLRSRAQVSPFDHGFLYGFGLFETVRAYGGRIFRLKQHLERLEKSAHEVGISRPEYDLAAACYEVLKANGLTDARLRLTLTAGPGEALPDPSTCEGPTVVIIAMPLKPPSPEKYQQGYRAVLSAFRRNSQSLLSRMKSTSYAESVLARREARLKGVDEVVMLNERGMVAEGSTSNLFLVKRGVLITPSSDSGILPGIARSVVLEIANATGLKTQERSVSLVELTQADEAFFTNSIREIMPLTIFEGKLVGSGKPGTVTLRLIEAYQALVRKETGDKSS